MKLGIKTRTIASYLILLAIFLLLMLLYANGLITLLTAVPVLVAATAVTAYIMVSRLIAPLEQVTTTAYEMAGGILEQEITVRGTEEIDDLAISINTMANQLRQHITKINEERNRAKAILDSMGDGVIALDSQGRVLMINPSMERLFKVGRKECLGEKVNKVIRNHELDQLLRRVLDHCQPLSREIKILLPEPRIFKVKATPLKGNRTKHLGVVAIMSDVTERRHLEKMRSEFVANVSHELRTPLTSIKGFLETLLDGAIDNPKTAYNFLNIMNVETERLTRLIDDLLKLSKLENKRTMLKKQEVDLSAIITQALKIFKPQAEYKAIKLETAIPSHLPLIQGEKDLLFQVLINLIDNAIKYTPVGGKVAVMVTLHPKELKVSVHDTGPGIPEEVKTRVFERFYRVDKARSRDAGGTGLGLAIAKHVVELHGGTITVQNHNQGAVFSFTVPLN
ncbi:two-component system histidine kinase PnpS [Desulfofalx alkaliphila]|uniref:two-component system histidine kinase PnpS n=1 Tax=Desulfofalx alkaliphila TaxID=105483 RepID=UPI0004E128DF|nr:ATP-binding protein [Desulfofalx alkaliphila]